MPDPSTLVRARPLLVPAAALALLAATGCPQGGGETVISVARPPLPATAGSKPPEPRSSRTTEPASASGGPLEPPVPQAPKPASTPREPASDPSRLAAVRGRVLNAKREPEPHVIIRSPAQGTGEPAASDPDLPHPGTFTWDARPQVRPFRSPEPVDALGARLVPDRILRMFPPTAAEADRHVELRHGEFFLEGLPPGEAVLEVRAFDVVASRTVTLEPGKTLEGVEFLLGEEGMPPLIEYEAGVADASGLNVLYMPWDSPESIGLKEEGGRLAPYRPGGQTVRMASLRGLSARPFVLKRATVRFVFHVETRDGKHMILPQRSREMAAEVCACTMAWGAPTEVSITLPLEAVSVPDIPPGARLIRVLADLQLYDEQGARVAFKGDRNAVPQRYADRLVVPMGVAWWGAPASASPSASPPAGRPSPVPSR